jgi:hypothetical protein
MLQPTIEGSVAIYGYSGKKSGLEVQEIEKIKLQDAPGLFKILMLHTTIKSAIGNIPMNAVDESYLPEVDYTALAHLHINYNKQGKVYCGPTFPNNISELEELKYGSFYIFEYGNIKKQEIKLKDVVSIRVEIKDALSATEKIISLIKNEDVQDKIVIVRIFGILEKGKTTDIDFQKIETYTKQRKALVLLKSTSKLHMAESDVAVDISDAENLETQIIKKFKEKNPGKFNALVPSLMRSLQIKKLEDETVSSFEDRLFSEINAVLGK